MSDMMLEGKIELILPNFNMSHEVMEHVHVVESILE
jgi:hypothetical protein